MVLRASHRLPVQKLTRLGLDLLYLVPGESGGRERYARELVPAMLERAPDLEVVAFVNRDAGSRLGAELGDRVRTVVLPVSARDRAQWALGELALVARAARRTQIQLLHSMANFAPPWGPFRRVVTIHDMQYRAVPELLSPMARSATHALVSIAAHRADRVIAVSRAGRDEISAGLGIPTECIDVIHNGVREAPTCIDTSGLRERHRLGERPIVLTVATQLPHKNLSVLIPALALMAPAQRPALVIVGHGTDDGRLRAAAFAADMAESVHVLGAGTNDELERLYASASCLVLPTLHEGFGMPALEAMARSLPVACSDIPSLREVTGDAALYFDPRDPAQIATQIGELIGNEQLAHTLRDKGLANVRRFSWSSAAARTLASYDRALGVDLGPRASPRWE